MKNPGLMFQIAFGVSFSLFFIDLFSTDYTWNLAGGGNWEVNANWTSTPAATYPNAPADTATFGPANPTAASTISLTGPITVNSITFSTAQSCTVQNGTLTLAINGSTNPALSVSAGNQTISTPITLGGDLSITSTGGITLGGIISESPAGKSISITGNTTLNGANTYSGGTTVVSGIVTVGNNAALGTGSVTMNGGTLQAGANYTSSQSFALSGGITFNSQTFAMTLSGPITGSGSFTKTGTSTLILSSANNQYSGGTVINQGTLQVSADSNLGATSGGISIGAATLNTTTNVFTSARSISLTGGSATFQTVVETTLSGPISGSGSLVKTGADLLILTGANSYTGGTTVSGGTLQGTTTSLQGNITDNATLVFNQTSSGTYAGVLSGTGTFDLSGGGPLTLTGTSLFTGTTNVISSQLVVNGSLPTTTATITANSILSGSGSLGNGTGTITVNGSLIPGNQGIGTLTINDNLTLGVGSIFRTQLTPTSNGSVAVSNTATITNGTLVAEPIAGSGFFGITKTYTILTGNPVTGPFASYSVTDANFTITPVYLPNSVQLLVSVLRPFQNFSCGNFNECAVANNIDDIHVAGTMSADMILAIDSLAGQSISEINSALDQMHPAALSAFAEIQTELGGQLLSLFHRSPALVCSCSGSSRFWVEPYGNWLEEKKQGMQIQFNATTRGVAFGFDQQFFNCWTLGIGGAWNATDIEWSLNRGYAYIDSLYGSFYSDLIVDDFYLGGSVYAGKDSYDAFRQLHFSSVDRQAKSHSHGFDIAGQLTTAYFFGTPNCLLYPYATVDYLYLKNSSFSETGADSFDLRVDDYNSSTLRAEAGGAWRFVDRNRDDTICISPLISMGYVLELPLHRDHYQSRFAGQNISFITKGWDMAWQLLNLRFGLGITYRCFTLDSQYIADISPEGDSPFFNQRANFRFSYSF